MTRKTLLGGVALAAMAASIAAAPVAAAGPAVRASVTDGTLRIVGSSASDHIALRLSPVDRTQLQVDVGDNGSADRTFDLRTFGAIDVEAGNGNDTVRIDQVNGIFTTTTATRIDGQNGDDTLIGGSGNEVLVGGRGDDVVDGNGGADTAFLGQGDDTFVWDPGDGSDVVEGGAGFDKMVFNGAGGNEIMAATNNFGRVSFTRNLGGIVMDLNDVEAIDVNALDGTDSITVNNVTGTDLRRVNVDLAAALGGSTADGKADTVTVAGTKGDDSIAVDANGSDVVEGGTGFDKMVFNGAGGNEIMAATNNFGRVSFTRNLGGIVMDLNDVEAIDVNALDGTDSITVNNVTGTDLRRVIVDLAAALGGSTADGKADTVTVAGTKGDDAIAVNANGSAVDVSGLTALVRITHADPDKDALVIDPVTGNDHVTIDPAVQALIQASVQQ